MSREGLTLTETTLEIRFHADDEASLRLQSTAQGDAEKQAEIVLFCLYAARAIANLRQTDSARMLTEALVGLVDASDEDLAAFAAGDGPATSDVDAIRVTFLEQGEAAPNERMFQATVRFLGNEPNPRIVFTMKPRGFGLLGKSVDYYAPGSVLVLLYSLLKRRADDVAFMRRLGTSAGAIGRLAATDKYAFGNQMDVAVAAADVGWRAVGLHDNGKATYASLECPACGNTGSLSPVDMQFEYRVWPSDSEEIRRCRRCGAGLWVREDMVRMISSDTWLGMEAMRKRLSEDEPAAVDGREERPREGTTEKVDGTLLGGLKKVFVDYRWPFSEVPDMPVLLSELSGPLGSWTFYAQVVEDQELIAFYSVCPLSVPEGRRQEVADFLTRANYGLALGNFELDFEDGEIRYKTVLEVDGQYISPALVKRLVKANGLAMETYLPGIGAVVAGTPALPALDRLTTD
jgi:hypothetical protein